MKISNSSCLLGLLKLSLSRLQRLLLSCALSGLGWSVILAGMTYADCRPQSTGVLMATPLSSRMGRVGDAIQAVVEHPLALSPTMSLPSGTLLKGRVTAVKLGERSGTPGKIQFQFTQASTMAFGVFPILAMPATEGGWLQQQDANTPVWQVSMTHSTRLLNATLQRRLGTNQAVWASGLGISENIIPDITTDQFIETYHRNNVLVGAGDRIYVRFNCP